MIALVHHYHGLSPKYTKREICMLIKKDHGIAITERQLKYICKKEGLSKCRNIDYSTLKEMVANELDSSRSKVGYRQMSEIINLRYGTRIAKESIRKALKDVDPAGVEERRGRVLKRKVYETKGPNEVYHIDGNDKLKKWGFCIHAGVDGFSRKVLWMNVASTNKDPIVIVNYFLDCIRRHRIAPRKIRMDFGTENIYCEDLQVFLTNDEDSFRYGSSTANQRIEAYWSRLKKFRLHWWIQYFTDMFELGLYKPYLPTHKETLLFCFLPVIQRELNEFVIAWNARTVRQSSSAPGGKADILFAMPRMFGYEDQGIPVNYEDIRIAEDVLAIEQCPVWIEKDIHELINCYVHIHNLDIPVDSEGACNLYVKILAFFENDNFSV